jgi:hypothetical protein
MFQKDDLSFLIEAAEKGWWDMAAREGKLLEIFIMTNANHSMSCLF